MIYAKANTQGGQALVIALAACTDADQYRRLKIIDLSSQGTPVPTLAELFNVSKATVRTYIHRYNTGGLSGLKRTYSPGRPVHISLGRSQWEELLHQSPSNFERLGSAARNWTQDLLVCYLKVYHEIKVSKSAISKHFKALKIRFNRGKLTVTSPDPDYVVKRDRIKVLKKSPAGSVNQP